MAELFGLPSVLTTGDRAPSVLNGGLANGWVEGALVFSFILSAIVEGLQIANRGTQSFENDRPPANWRPGNFNFDPLALYAARSSFILDRVSENLTRYL